MLLTNRLTDWVETKGKIKRNKDGVVVSCEPPIKLGIIKCLRGCDETFSNIFMERFLKHVVGKREWEQRLKNVKTADELVTVSDEAFCLLTLENGWDAWLDILVQSDGRFRQAKRGRSAVIRPRRAKYKFTAINSAKKKRRKRVQEEEDNNETSDEEDDTDDEKQARLRHSWTDEGIQAFNTIAKQVQDNRLANANNNAGADWLKRKQSIVSNDDEKHMKFVTKPYCDW